MKSKNLLYWIAAVFIMLARTAADTDVTATFYPTLKGLRFNRFVTDSNHNTTKPIHDKKIAQNDIKPGCDFLLHDGRACDAIEAAFLHDGPAVKQLGMIDKLNHLNLDQLTALRAFLYSL